MKTILYCKCVSVAVLVAVMGLFLGVEQVRADPKQGYGVTIPGPIGYPPYVLFVGKLYTPEQKKEAAGISTIKVLIDRKEWLFKIKKAFDLSGNMTELDIINYIWPAPLRLTGVTKDALIPLQKSDIAGKRFAIHGDLYYVERMLRVESVREIEEKKD